MVLSLHAATAMSAHAATPRCMTFGEGKWRLSMAASSGGGLRVSVTSTWRRQGVRTTAEPPFRQRAPPVRHDRAVPVAIAALELRELVPGGRIVYPETASGVVNEQQAAGHDRARTGVPIPPHWLQLAVVDCPCRRTAVVGGEEPGRGPAAQHRGRREPSRPG